MLTGAVLYAKDLEKLSAFYQALGPDVACERHSDFTRLSHAGQELILLQIPDHIAANISIEAPPRVRAETPLKPIIVVGALREACHAIGELGGRLLPGAAEWEFQGHRVQDIVDPEGNVVQLWQPLPA